MAWSTNWAENNSSNAKPELEWINSYVKADGTVVQGHWRTEANETTADNLGTDIDNDGIPGFFDADADGDGINEALDLNGDGIADGLEGLLDFFA